MNNNELDEISKLPRKYRPLGAWAYFGYSVLFSIPLVGWVFLVIFALSPSNINRRSFARSYFCVIVLIFILSVIFAAIYHGLGYTQGILSGLRQ